jgi:signal transduction histidine kinase
MHLKSWKNILGKLKLPQAENTSLELVRRMELTNFLVVACLLINVVGMVYDYYLAYSVQLMVVDGIGVVFYALLFGWHLVYKRQVVTALVLFLALLVHIIYMNLIFGRDVYIILYLYNLMIVSFFIFDVRSLQFRILMALSVVSVYWLELFGFNLGLHMNLTTEEVMSLRLFCLVANVLLFIVMVIVMERGIRQVGITLISNRKKVGELSDRLQMLCNLKEEYNTSLLNQRDSLLMNKGDLKAISSLTSIRSEEQERARIGKELSQSVGELLIKFKLRMGNLSKHVDHNDRKEFEDTLRLVDLARDEIGRLSEVLDPLEFNRLRLDEALRKHIKKLKSQYHVSIDFLNVGYKNQLAKEQELVVYRVLSEILSTMVENDQVKHCDVRMEVVEIFMAIRIQQQFPVGYDSKGDEWLQNPSFQDRIQVIGGFIHHKSDALKGNTILIEIPVPEMEQQIQTRSAS